LASHKKKNLDLEFITLNLHFSLEILVPGFCVAIKVRMCWFAFTSMEKIPLHILLSVYSYR